MVTTVGQHALTRSVTPFPHDSESIPMFASRSTVAAVVLAGFSVAACKAKPAPAPAPVPVAAAPAPVAGPRINQDSIDAARRADAARAAAAEEARRNAAAIAAAKATLAQTVFFDYDKDEIRADQQATLDAKVPILTNNPNMRIRIAGHTDNRGSDEYNLALGQRRAATTKRYLIARGIADARIDVVSFGEERPAAQGDNEDAWAKNRRAEFEITAGGDNIKVSR
jgi:peptidoglycan-associated lipoprotein